MHTTIDVPDPLRVFSAFFDETGTAPDTDLLWIAGYIAEEKTWFEFSRHWRAVLAEHGVSALHMRHSSASRGEFLGWDESRRRPFMEDLISVVNSCDLWGVAVGVDKAAFESTTFPMKQSPSSLTVRDDSSPRPAASSWDSASLEKCIATGASDIHGDTTSGDG